MSSRRAAVSPIPLLAAVALAACGQPAARTLPVAAAASPEGGAPPCQPLETRSPNAPEQVPAFPGQTRACPSPIEVAFEVEVVARGLEHPWSVEPLPDGGLLVSERPGRLRRVSQDGEVGPPIAGLPPVDARGQGGLLDLVLSPGFAEDRTLWWSFSEPRDGGNGTSVARGRLSQDGSRLEDVQVILRTQPTYDGTSHFGSRLLFGPDGMLYVTLGERSDTRMRAQAQRLDSHLGKILRVHPDGTAPADNPFAGERGALPEIWSLGHRNIQAAAFDSAGRLWEIEHGARGGDELNRVERGANYGWPLQAYGEEYIGTKIRGSRTARAGMEQPVYYWDPVIAPSGAQFYDGEAFPAWRGSLFIGALRGQRLVRLDLADGRVTGEQHLLVDRGQRVRDVRQGPDGLLYLVTDEGRGELWRLVPRG